MEYAGQSNRVSLGENDLFEDVIPRSGYMSTLGLGFGNVASRFGPAFSSKTELNSSVTKIDDYQDGGKIFVTFVGNRKLRGSRPGRSSTPPRWEFSRQATSNSTRVSRDGSGRSSTPWDLA